MKNLFQRYLNNCPNFSIDVDDFDKILGMYSQPHRHFHTMKHIEHLWDCIDGCNNHKGYEISKDETEILYSVALFHDVVYFPQNKDNEEKSVEYFDGLRFIEEQDYKHYHDGIVPNPTREEHKKAIRALIIGTKTHEPVVNYERLSKIFNTFDMSSVRNDMEEVESAMFKEYQFHSISDYRNGRMKFLREICMPDDYYYNHILQRVNYLQNRQYNVGIFAGTFNPWHKGHQDVLEKAEKMFDKVIIVCAKNGKKVGLNHDEIFNSVKETLPFHEVVQWDGLITDYIRSVESQGAKVSIIKGFRDAFDIPYEMNIYRYAQDLMPEISVVYFPTDRDVGHISSSGINALIGHGADVKKYLVSKYDYAKGSV